MKVHWPKYLFSKDEAKLKIVLKERILSLEVSELTALIDTLRKAPLGDLNATIIDFPKRSKATKEN